MKYGKKLLSMILSLALLICLLPGASASGIESGTCGPNLTWTFYASTGELVISGYGEMDDFGLTGPWWILESSIKSVTIQNGVTSIGNGAFGTCMRISQIHIPSSVKRIGEWAFSGCDSLKTLTLERGLVSIEAWAFYGCIRLEEISIPDTVSTIGDFAFSGCDRLRSVTFGKGLTYIGNDAFSDCPELASVSFKGCSPTIDEHAFSGCNQLSSVYISDLSAWCKTRFALTKSNPLFYNAILYLNNEPVQELVIPEDITAINPFAFCYCSSIEEVVLHKNVSSIGEVAFGGCPSLTAFRVAADNPTYSAHSSGALLNRDGTALLAYPSGLGEEYTIPEEITELGPYAFFGASKLLHVSINENITAIPPHCFEECSNLLSVTIPESVISVEDWAFNICHKLCHVLYTGTQAQWNSITFPSDSYHSGYLLSPTRHYEAKGDELQWKEAEGCRYLYCSICQAAVHCNHDSTRLEGVLEPSCSEAGYTGDTYCCFCGELLAKGEEIPERGHREIEMRDHIPVTCTESGYTGDHYCLICGQMVREGIVLDPLGHRFVDGICIRCGAPDPETIALNPFTDVQAGDYYYVPILWAVEEGITNGTTPTTFSPNDPCTRGQIVTFLWRAFGSPEPSSAENPFTDVPEQVYYYKAILWAVEKGITTGISPTEFGPEVTCTRGQVATFLWRACGKPTPKSNENPFSDVTASVYYYEPILWAVEEGITNGTGGGKFSPEDSCTRGQIVTFLYRALES